MKDRDRRIIELYQSGLTMRATGEAFGLTRTRVWQILVDNGIERREPLKAWSLPNEEGKAAISRKNRQHGAAKRKARGMDDVLELLKSGMTRQQIAQAKGLTYNAVCGLVRRERQRRETQP